MSKLIWFQHLHKCAGTSVVALAKDAGRVFYPRSRNGNPLDEDRKIIDFGLMSRDHFRCFIDETMSLGVDFIASEFSSPYFDELSENKDIELITVLRDPLSRYISNYNYDLNCGFTRASSIDHYRNSSGDWTKFNYYTSVFSFDRAVNFLDSKECSHDDFEIAIRNLKKFNLTLNAGSATFNTDLAQFFNVSPIERKVNRSKGPIWKMLLGRLRRGDPRPALNVLMANRKISEEFIVEFKRSNELDYALFNSLGFGRG